MVLKHNRLYYGWNDVELRSVDEGSIGTGHMCNVCYAIVPDFHFEEHIDWHSALGHDIEVKDDVSA